MTRAAVAKTYKLYIGGKFVRSESGRCFVFNNPTTKKVIANVALASRKDLRDSVVHARKAFKGWSGKTAYNRGQILYRIAEMLESRKVEFVDLIMNSRGATRKEAEKEVAAAIDRLVWYAGWTDKYSQVFGAINPVALPYFSFTLPEPTGVVGSFIADNLSLLPLVSKVAPIIASGNTVICIVPEKSSVVSLVFAEICHSSDVPSGVINILAAPSKDLAPHLSKHMDVNAVDYTGNDLPLIKGLQIEGSQNLKRVVIGDSLTDKEWFEESSQSPYQIGSFVEMKTNWHPVGV